MSISLDLSRTWLFHYRYWMLIQSQTLYGMPEVLQFICKKKLISSFNKWKFFIKFIILIYYRKKTEIERRNYLLEKKLSSIVDSICSYHFFFLLSDLAQIFVITILFYLWRMLIFKMLIAQCVSILLIK